MNLLFLNLFKKWPIFIFDLTKYIQKDLVFRNVNYYIGYILSINQIEIKIVNQNTAASEIIIFKLSKSD